MKDLSLHLMDILQNSITAQATQITVSIHSDINKDRLELAITDNGCGMDKDMLCKVTDPFVTTRTTRKVGLGIPLLKLSAEMAGGSLEIHSHRGEGTVLKAGFQISHIDRIPLGDIAETFASVIMAHPDIEYELLLENSHQFKFSSLEVKEHLGEVPITDYEVIQWIREYIKEGLKITFGGVLHEIIS